MYRKFIFDGKELFTQEIDVQIFRLRIIQRLPVHVAKRGSPLSSMDRELKNSPHHQRNRFLVEH